MEGGGQLRGKADRGKAFGELTGTHLPILVSFLLPHHHPFLVRCLPRLLPLAHPPGMGG